MNIGLVEVKKTTDRTGLFLLQNSPLACPFHPYKPAEYLANLAAYKAYLFRTLEKNGDPRQVAGILARKYALMGSRRWPFPSLKQLQLASTDLLSTPDLKIAQFNNPDPAQGLAAYLTWKQNTIIQSINHPATAS